MDLDKRIETKKERNMSNNGTSGFNFKKLLPWLIVGVLAVWLWGSYNGLVSKSEGVENAWGGVQTSYQSRADKVKNLMKIVEGAADYEKGTLTEVIKARAAATSVTIDPSNLTPETMAKFEAAQGQLTGALSKLLVTVERYPDLKAVSAFRDFQAQYEGIENRIQKSRDDFNGTVKTYNMKVKKFPGTLVASMFGFEAKPYFKAQAGTENAPDIEF
jgi:LemA protein